LNEESRFSITFNALPTKSAAALRDAQLVVMGVPYQEKFGEYCVQARAQYVLEHAGCRVILAREPLPLGQSVSNGR
jgi:hypothetical protein